MLNIIPKIYASLMDDDCNNICSVCKNVAENIISTKHIMENIKYALLKLIEI